MDGLHQAPRSRVCRRPMTPPTEVTGWEARRSGSSAPLFPLPLQRIMLGSWKHAEGRWCFASPRASGKAAREDKPLRLYCLPLETGPECTQEGRWATTAYRTGICGRCLIRLCLGARAICTHEQHTRYGKDQANRVLVRCRSSLYWIRDYRAYRHPSMERHRAATQDRGYRPRVRR